jgi:ubiquinone/menaquinone biosynthesis C-methylase UbiE
MENERYNEFWESCDILHDTFEKRSTGELPEMESSKSLAALLEKEGQGRKISVLDAGCGLGHYYVSIKKRLPDAAYEGCDVTARYIERAKDLWKDAPVKFTRAQIGKMPYSDCSFDYVVCINVILHIPPPVYSAVRDILRVCRKAAIIRTPIAERTYFIKELRSYDLSEGGGRRRTAKEIDDATTEFNYLNLYEKRHLDEIIIDAAAELEVPVSIEWRRDEAYKAFDNTKENDSRTATRVINGLQVSGAIILDWHYIIIRRDQ